MLKFLLWILSNQAVEKLLIDLAEYLAKQTETKIDDEGVRIVKNLLNGMKPRR